MPSPYFLKVDPNSHILRLEPDLRYSGLELTTGGYNPQGIRYLTPSTDVFALGVLAFEVYRFNIQQAPHACIIGVVNNNVNYHLPALEALSVLDYSFLPPSGPAGGIKEILRGMMDLQVRTRFSTDMISSHPFCSTGAIAFLRTVDTLAARDVGTQASLLLSLPQHMTAFPPRLLERTVLPTICRLCVGNPGLWTHSLHIHIYMTERMTVQKYRGIAYLLMHVVHPVLSFVSELFTTNMMISFLIYSHMHIISMRTQPLHCRTVIIILFFILSLSLSLSLSLPLS